MVGVAVERLDAAGAEAEFEGLVGLLADAVENGASVGFEGPLDLEVARAYWRGVVGGVAVGTTRLLVARVEGAVVGTVQLVYARYPNGRHRAEVSKLLVHSSVRRRGVASALMGEAERWAVEEGRWLLFLDTETGSGAEGLYRGLGWEVAGVIPDFAYRPFGGPAPSTFYFKRLGRG